MPMNNKLKDLNDHLFVQMERLSEKDLSGRELENEIKRSKQMVAVSDNIIRIAQTTLKGLDLIAMHGDRFANALEMIEAPKTPDYKAETLK